MSNNVRVEDRLEGSINFYSWKIRITTILEELELETFIEKDMLIPEDEIEKETWKRRNNKAKKIIVDSVKDHILPSIENLKKAFEIFTTIKNAFEINNSSRLITLKNQLMNIKMNKGETISSYFGRISEIRNHLNSIGNKVEDQELSILTLRGLPISWDAFIQVVSRPSIPSFDQLKNDCISEESRLISRGIVHTQEEENHALVSTQNHQEKKRKFKGKKNDYKKKNNKSKDMISPKYNVINVRNLDIFIANVQKGRES